MSNDEKSKVRSGNSAPRLKTDGFSCHKAYKKNRAAALITALFVVAIAAVIGASMVSNLQLHIRRSANILSRDISLSYALGAESWALVILNKNDKHIDHLKETWATKVAPVAIEGGLVGGYIIDLQRGYNLNNLVDLKGKIIKKELAYLQQLLVVLQLKPELAMPIADWIDKDSIPQYPEGVEENTYLLMQPAYRAANNKMADITELRLIKGIDAKSYAKLVPHLCVLPQPSSININTASAEVIQALNNEISESMAKKIIKKRKQKYFQSINEFTQQAELKTMRLDATKISVNSAFFQIHSQVKVGEGQVHLVSNVQREKDNFYVYQRQQDIF